VTEVTVRAAVLARLVYRQGDLFGGQAGPDRREDVTGLVERLNSRLGSAAVLRPRLVADAQPELSFRYDPWLTAAGETEDTVPAPIPLTRPTCLWETPEPVQVMSATPDGPPG